MYRHNYSDAEDLTHTQLIVFDSNTRDSKTENDH